MKLSVTKTLCDGPTLRQNAVDVVVLDLGLPGVDGFEIIEQLREQGSTIPIVVLSSRTDEAGKVEALDLGAFRMSAISTRDCERSERTRRGDSACPGWPARSAAAAQPSGRSC